MTLNCDIYASRRRLRAWHGGGGGGALSWTGGLFSTPLAADFAGAWPEGGGGEVRSWTGSLLSTPLAAGSGPEEAAEGPISWTWSLLSTPLAADFGPGPEARLRGGESAFHRLSKLPTASGLARRPGDNSQF